MTYQFLQVDGKARTHHSWVNGQTDGYEPPPPGNYMDGPMGTDIDPQLVEHLTVPSHPPSPWELQNHTLQQYMKDPQSSFFSVDHFPPVQFGVSRPLQHAESCPRTSQDRRGSPFSHQPSSVSGDAYSPLTDNDMLPSTPGDAFTASPLLQPCRQFDSSWSRQAQVHVLAGIGQVQESLSVNPLDVNPTWDLFDADTEYVPGSFRFTPEPQTELQPTPTQALNSPPRPLNSGTPTKDRIFIHSHPERTVYPDPQDVERVTVELVPSKRMMVDDDYTPPKSSRKRGRGETTWINGHPARVSTRNGRKRLKPDNITSAPKKPLSPLPASLDDKTDQSSYPEYQNDTSKDEQALEKHTKAKQIRPFVCVFKFAGCSSSFPNKNEWKRHVNTQHLALHYWVCTQDGCGRTENPIYHPRRVAHLSSSSSASSSSSQDAEHAYTDVIISPHEIPSGAIFNRKDLYTQHVRRMHVPISTSKALVSDNRLRQLQEKATRTRCQLPRSMGCPARECGQRFKGRNAWDERMEHVAKHLEKAAEGSEPMVEVGGDSDPSLTEWAESPEVGVVRRTEKGGWELLDPLRRGAPRCGKNRRGVSAAATVKREVGEPDDEADADGDED